MRRNCGSSSRNMGFWLATPPLHVRSVGDRFLAQSSCIGIKNIGGACGKGAKNWSRLGPTACSKDPNYRHSRCCSFSTSGLMIVGPTAFLQCWASHHQMWHFGPPDCKHALPMQRRRGGLCLGVGGKRWSAMRPPTKGHGRTQEGGQGRCLGGSGEGWPFGFGGL